MKMTPQRSLLRAAEAPEPNRTLALASDAKKADSLSALSDADVNRILLAASDAASTWCGVHSVAGGAPTFARQNVTETIIIPAATYEPQRRKLFLSLYPATVTAVTFDAVAFDIAETFLDGRALTFLPNTSRRVWPVEQAIAVTYAAGYVTPPQAAEETPPTGPALPADIEQAVIIAAQHLYAQQTRAQFDVAASVEEDSDAGRMETRYFNAGRSPGLPGAATALLEPYRRLF